MREPELTFGTPKGNFSQLTFNTPNVDPFAICRKKGSGWSVTRRLNPLYSGPLVRVRRSLDNTEQDIFCDSNGNLDQRSLYNFCNPGPENLVASSEAYNNTNWTKTNITVTDNVIANPINGAITASLLTDVTGTTNHNISANSLIFYSGTIPLNFGKSTLKFYVKANVSSFMTYRLFFSPSGQFCYRSLNFTTGVVTQVNTNWGSNSVITVTTLPDGWFLIEENFSPIIGGRLDTGLLLNFYTSTTATNYLSYVGNGSSFYLYGVQVYRDHISKSYTSTTIDMTGSGYITTLYDQFNDRHATQPTLINQPRIMWGGLLELLGGFPTSNTITSNVSRSLLFSPTDLLRNVEGVTCFAVVNQSSTSYYNQRGVINIPSSTSTNPRFRISNQVTTNNVLIDYTRIDGQSFTSAVSRPLRAGNFLYSVYLDYRNNFVDHRENSIQRLLGINGQSTGTRTSNTNSVQGCIGAITPNAVSAWDRTISEVIIIPEDCQMYRAAMENNIMQYYKL
jgi:hypothetical protein